MQITFVKRLQIKTVPQVKVLGGTSKITGSTKVGSHFGDRKWHYYDDNGVMLKNTIVDGFKLDADGALVADTTLKIDGKDYVFKYNGVCTNKLD